MKMKKKSSGGGANWMDTYGDMVTLLLCFFVLLYSMSTVDQSKYIALVRSFNPEALATLTENSGDGGPMADDLNGLNMDAESLQIRQQQIEQAMEQVYQMFSSYSGNSEGMIELTKGDGYVFVSFNDAIFFDGDSYVLRADGEQVLLVVSDILSQVSEYIDEVRIMGHTAQAMPDKANRVDVDRFLASNRATIAGIFIQEHSTLDPASIVTVGYGQHRPISPNDTAENRSHNRRVELVISGGDMANQLGNSLEQYYSIRQGTGPAEDGSGAQ